MPKANERLLIYASLNKTVDYGIKIQPYHLQHSNITNKLKLLKYH